MQALGYDMMVNTILFEQKFGSGSDTCFSYLDLTNKKYHALYRIWHQTQKSQTSKMDSFAEIVNGF